MEKAKGLIPTARKRPLASSKAENKAESDMKTKNTMKYGNNDAAIIICHSSLNPEKREMVSLPKRTARMIRGMKISS